MVESVKAVSDLYAPATGKVTAVNSRLNDEPHLINQDPHGEAWLIKMELNDGGVKAISNGALMDSFAYEKLIATA